MLDEGVIQAAFEAECVDIMIRGDWEDVQVDLGLLPERITQRPPLDVLGRFGITPRRTEPPIPSAGAAARVGRREDKRRRKAEKQARKRNRRK